MIGTGLTSVYFLIMINKAFFGRLSESVVNLPSVQWRDRIPAMILALIIVILGIQPNLLVRLTDASTTALAHTQPLFAHHLAEKV